MFKLYIMYHSAKQTFCQLQPSTQHNIIPNENGKPYKTNDNFKMLIIINEQFFYAILPHLLPSKIIREIKNPNKKRQRITAITFCSLYHIPYSLLWTSAFAVRRLTWPQSFNFILLFFSADQFKLVLLVILLSFSFVPISCAVCLCTYLPTYKHKLTYTHVSPLGKEYL